MHNRRLMSFIYGLFTDFRIRYALIGAKGSANSVRKLVGFADFLVDEPGFDEIRKILRSDDFSEHELFNGFVQFSPPDKDNLLGFLQADEPALLDALNRAVDKPLGKFSIRQLTREDLVLVYLKVIQRDKSLRSQLLSLIEDLMESAELDFALLTSYFNSAGESKLFESLMGKYRPGDCKTIDLRDHFAATLPRYKGK
ncbi:MAG: hypothetical protein PHW04_17620 [Candidatus Wallbacteria bacterium]|nr:hypothetical protein [Candidatus Wallbacteria bacterium]